MEALTLCHIQARSQAFRSIHYDMKFERSVSRSNALHEQIPGAHLSPSWALALSHEVPSSDVQVPSRPLNLTLCLTVLICILAPDNGPDGRRHAQHVEHQDMQLPRHIKSSKGEFHMWDR